MDAPSGTEGIDAITDTYVVTDVSAFEEDEVDDSAKSPVEDIRSNLSATLSKAVAEKAETGEGLGNLEHLVSSFDNACESMHGKEQVLGHVRHVEKMVADGKIGELADTYASISAKIDAKSSRGKRLSPAVRKTSLRGAIQESMSVDVKGDAALGVKPGVASEPVPNLVPIGEIGDVTAHRLLHIGTLALLPSCRMPCSLAVQPMRRLCTPMLRSF